MTEKSASVSTTKIRCSRTGVEVRQHTHCVGSVHSMGQIFGICSIHKLIKNKNFGVVCSVHWRFFLGSPSSNEVTLRSSPDPATMNCIFFRTNGFTMTFSTVPLYLQRFLNNFMFFTYLCPFNLGGVCKACHESRRLSYRTNKRIYLCERNIISQSTQIPWKPLKTDRGVGTM